MGLEGGVYREGGVGREGGVNGVQQDGLYGV